MGTQRAKRIDTDAAIGNRPIDARRVKTCVNESIKTWWPQAERYGGQDFEHRMRALQIDMIRCHFDAMTRTDQARAVETLTWLESRR